MGRHNRENVVIVPGGWNEVASLSGDDAFSAPSSQLYAFIHAVLAALLVAGVALAAAAMGAEQRRPKEHPLGR